MGNLPKVIRLAVLGLLMCLGVALAADPNTVNFYAVNGTGSYVYTSIFRQTPCGQNTGSMGGGSAAPNATTLVLTLTSGIDGWYYYYSTTPDGNGPCSGPLPASSGTTVNVYWNVGSGTIYTNGPGGTTYQYATGTWTNNSSKYAVPEFAFVDAGGGLHYPTNMSAVAVAPGGVWPFAFTNDFAGTPSWIVFDSRPGSEATERTGSTSSGSHTATGGYYGNSGPAGSGSTMGNTNITGVGTAGGTNGASQADIYRMGDLLVHGLAGLEYTLSGLGSNNVFGTNGMGGTNVFVNNLASNLAPIGSNISGLLSNALWASNIYSFRTGALWGVLSNLSDSVGYGTNLAGLSNTAWQLAGTGILAYAPNGGQGDLISGLGAHFHDSVPVDSFGVLHVTKLGVAPGADDYITVDFKPAISMQPIEDWVPGTRGWFRLIILWSAIVWLITMLVRELRESIWHSLTPSSDMSSNALTYAGAAAPLGPVAAGGVFAAVVTRKALTVLVMVGALLMIPSILIAVAATTMTMIGEGPTYLAATSGTVASASPTVMFKVLALVGVWLPWFELCVVSLNYGFAHFSIDSVTSFLMVYVKIQEK